MESTPSFRQRSETVPDRRSIHSRNRAATRVFLVIGLLSVFLLRPARALADERAELIARLRSAATRPRFGVPKETTSPSQDFELWRFGFQEPGGVLAEIGALQVDLGDLEGARITAKALPIRSKCLNCGDAYNDFLKGVSTALVRAGKTDEAIDVLKSHGGQDGISTDQWLAIAKAQADRGDRDAARASCAIAAKELSADHGCRCGPPGAFDLPDGLVYVAFGEVAIGDDAGARKTCEQIDALLAKAPKKGIDLTILITRLAVARAKLGDVATARRLLQEAPGTINYEHPTDIDSLNLAGSWLYIAEGLCRLGDIDGARTAASKSGDREQEAFAELAIYLWSQRRIEEAKKTILAAPPGAPTDLVLIEIAKDQARARVAEGDALETVGHITNDLYRALGTLEVAAGFARQGKRDFARTIARKLNYPVVRRMDEPAGTRFKFDDIETWDAGYESSRSYSSNSHFLGQEMDGELLAAAVRCRVALDGPGAIRFDARMNEHHWDIRNAAKAQASEGDVSGVLACCDRLTPVRRLVALIGAADGYIEFKTNPPASPPAHRHLERHHPLRHRYGIHLGRLYGDE
jgi:tetratricopeptide (TPR) repeat protein